MRAQRISTSRFADLLSALGAVQQQNEQRFDLVEVKFLCLIDGKQSLQLQFEGAPARRKQDAEVFVLVVEQNRVRVTKLHKTVRRVAQWLHRVWGSHALVDNTGAGASQEGKAHA